MAKAASIYLTIRVLAVLGLVGPTMQVITVVTHAFGIVFSIRMGAVGDGLGLLLGEKGGVHFLAHRIRLSIDEIVHDNWSGFSL